jgi:uncharacterized protein YegP (UPF0339 family)/cell division protein FtsB
VFVPILTDREELEAEVANLHADKNDLQESARTAESHEADLAERIAALQNSLSETERKNSDLADEIAQLKDDNADALADEADLAERIATLQTALSETERKNSELAAEIAQLNENSVDAMADEADLAAVISGHQNSQAQFELYEDQDGQWRWRLRHRNGNVIADGNQGYARKHGAQQGIRAVRRDALGASLLLVESEEDLPEEADDHGFIFADEVESTATFELYEGEGDEYRWRLIHDNGNVIADGREGFTSRAGAQSSIDGIRKYVGPAEYLQPDPTAIEVYEDEEGKWRWRLRHKNGNSLASSGEGYANRSSARRAIDRIRAGIGDMEIEVYEDEADGFRWRLAGGDDKIKVDSGSYESRDGAEDAVERVRTFMPEADLLDIGQAAFEVYEDEAGEHRWRLRHRNGNILAGDGQGYADKSGMWDSIESMKRNAPNAAFETVEH